MDDSAFLRPLSTKGKIQKGGLKRISHVCLEKHWGKSLLSFQNTRILSRNEAMVYPIMSVNQRPHGAPFIWFSIVLLPLVSFWFGSKIYRTSIREERSRSPRRAIPRIPSSWERCSDNLCSKQSNRHRITSRLRLFIPWILWEWLARRRRWMGAYPWFYVCQVFGKTQNSLFVKRQ